MYTSQPKRMRNAFQKTQCFFSTHARSWQFASSTHLSSAARRMQLKNTKRLTPPTTSCLTQLKRCIILQKKFENCPLTSTSGWIRVYIGWKKSAKKEINLQCRKRLFCDFSSHVVCHLVVSALVVRRVSRKQVRFLAGPGSKVRYWFLDSLCTTSLSFTWQTFWCCCRWPFRTRLDIRPQPAGKLSHTLSLAKT